MSGLRVVNFDKKLCAEKRHHADEVIRLLEEALQLARDGNCQSLAVLMMDVDGNIIDCWHNSDRPYVMVGALESLKTDFIHACIERR
ncbi:hypothetical protein FEM41_19940 [Jejubacter calystegiae]|uniref:Uncharacterized protein n=1 Tax=Jejubacter calystegiae TaxID=2579935 RepID=A0A4P8YLQ0_9ENTR|nr:hypothetical protein [Jejubacter calystegiae]QCT21761.1 hypothetical protein FEM41_19940 [Jejubacter calystegiae]